MKVLKAYKFRIYPTLEQEKFIKKTFSCVKMIHNLLLQDRITIYKELKEDPNRVIKLPTPAKYKKNYPHLKEVDSLALSNAQIQLDQSFKKFYREKSVGFPKKKQKHESVRSYTTNNQEGTIKIIDNRYLKIPKLKSLIKLRMHRSMIGKIKSATISLTPSHRYFVSILCEESILAMTKTNTAIGITLGCNALAVLSNGQRIDNDKYTEEIMRKIYREERKLKRRKERAHLMGQELGKQKNYQKQKIKVAKMREKLANQRLDFLNKKTAELVKEYDLICVEDVRKEEFCRNAKLMHTASDVSWSLFVSKLEYKALWHNKNVIKVSVCSESLESSDFSMDGQRISFIKDVDEQLAKKDPEVAASIDVLTKGIQKMVI